MCVMCKLASPLFVCVHVCVCVCVCAIHKVNMLMEHVCVRTCVCVCVAGIVGVYTVVETCRTVLIACVGGVVFGLCGIGGVMRVRVGAVCVACVIYVSGVVMVCGGVFVSA